MIEIPSAELAACAGVGVAGNFAGHLEQAGEAGDFVGVDAPERAPKGIFPWFLPGNEDFLGAFPISSDSLQLPAPADELKLQIEPEIGVIFDIEYAGGIPVGLAPRALGAFNDCSIRRPGARKISEKKNWGACSKGFARRCFEIDEISREAAAHMRLASFLRRGGECTEYGVDSPVAGYSYYGDALLEWLIDRMQNQRGGDGPLEDVGAQLADCGAPRQVLVGVGATRYTLFGQQNYLQAGDESIVVVYDERTHSPKAVADAARIGDEQTLEAASVLTQRVAATGQSPVGAARPT